MKFSIFILQFSIVLASGALIYAQPANLLTDSSFDHRSPAWRTLGQARYEVVEGLGRAGGSCLCYQKPQGEAATSENSHHDQEADVEPKMLYTAAAWFKCDGTLRPALRIASMDWQTIALGLSEGGTQWHEVRVLFFSGDHKRVRVQIFGGSLTALRESAPGTSYCDDVVLRKATEQEVAALHHCRVEVDAARVVRRINPLFFGVNSLFWMETDAVRAEGKVTKYLREMPCTLLRFPAGEVADNYHWKTHTLDDPKAWPSQEGPHLMDTDEFMPWCREIGAEPIFVVNLESSVKRGNIAEGVQEAAGWVAYCRQKGYRVRYWEIGNETYLKQTRHPMAAREYADAFVKFTRAMKAVDPTIKIGANGPTSASAVSPHEKDTPGKAWWPTVIEIAGPDLDFAVIHHYHAVKTESLSDDTQGLHLAQQITGLRQLVAERLPNREIPIALTEWNSWRRNAPPSAHALVLADMIGTYLAAGVDMANFWPLRTPGNPKGFRALLDQKTCEPLISYHVLKLFATRVGAQLVASKSSSGAVSSLGGLSEDGKRLTIFLVNKSPLPRELTLDVALRGFAAREATALALTCPEPSSEQFQEEQPALTAGGDGWACKLPPHSLGLLEFTR